MYFEKFSICIWKKVKKRNAFTSCRPCWKGCVDKSLFCKLSSIIMKSKNASVVL